MNATKLADLQLRLPPHAEQRRIVAAVQALMARVDAARDRLARSPATLKRFRQAVLAAACSGGLTEDWREVNPSVTSPRSLIHDASVNGCNAADHEDEIELPETWVRTRVDTLVFIQNGRAFPSKQYGASGIRLLRPGNLHVSGRVDWRDGNTAWLPFSWAREYPESVLGSGELLMNLTAQSLKDEFLGRVCIKGDEEPALLNQRIARFRNKGSFDVRPYLLLYFKSKFFRRFVNSLDTGSLIRHMHSKDVASHALFLPPPEEQVEIVRRVVALFALADAVDRRVQTAAERAKQIAQGIFAKAFRGQLVPTEADLAKRNDQTFEQADVLLERTRDQVR